MQRALAGDVPGLVARLLVRSEPGVDPQTWMEAYAAGARTGGVDAAVEAAIDRYAQELACFIEGERHAEAFVPAA